MAFNYNDFLGFVVQAWTDAVDSYGNNVVKGSVARFLDDPQGSGETVFVSGITFGSYPGMFDQSALDERKDAFWSNLKTNVFNRGLNPGKLGNTPYALTPDTTYSLVTVAAMDAYTVVASTPSTAPASSTAPMLGSTGVVFAVAERPSKSLRALKSVP